MTAIETDEERLVSAPTDRNFTEIPFEATILDNSASL